LINPDIKIIDLQPDDEAAIDQAAALLIEGFREISPKTWPDKETALKEVEEMLQAGRLNRITMDSDRRVLGWVGGIPHFRGNVWELHPIVVAPEVQGRGIGRALVKDLEERVKERGGYTIWLGTDDEENMTTVSGIDLYPNVLENLQNIRNIKRHPYEFYQKVGFTITGVLPDANGPGKPDIFMAKRVGG
jgi:aminoglycoside 6'-N-acetyltransferase I